jgi:hypothetical protein
MRGSPFFDGVAQSEVTIAGQQVRLPIFYYDGSSIQAVFAAKLGALRKLMPDPRFCPARIAPGLGAVAVTCFEYRDTDIGPYNELAISVVLNEPYFIPNLPGLALVSSMRRRQLHAWVHHLPVTTEIARAAGVDLYNYPKFVAGIDFSEEGARRVCRLSEGAEHILTLSGERIATPRSEQFQAFSRLWMDRQPQSSEFKLNASETGVSVRSGVASLKLGDRHPIARELAGLIAFSRPLQYQYTARFEGILYGPEHLSLPLLDRIAKAEAAETAGSAKAETVEAETVEADAVAAQPAQAVRR